MSLWVCVSQRVGESQLTTIQTFDTVMVSQCNASLCAEAEKIVDDSQILCCACVSQSNCTASLLGDSLPCCLAMSTLAPVTVTVQYVRKTAVLVEQAEASLVAATIWHQRGSNKRTIKSEPRSLEPTAGNACQLVWPRTAVKRNAAAVRRMQRIRISQSGHYRPAWSKQSRENNVLDDSKHGRGGRHQKKLCGQSGIISGKPTQRMATGGSAVHVPQDTDQQDSANCSISCMTAHGKDKHRDARSLSMPDANHAYLPSWH